MRSTPNELLACDPLSDEMVDLSLRVYADDVNKTHCTVDPKHTSEVIQHSDKQLDTALRGIGVVQSQGKKAVLPHYVGPGANAYNKHVFYGSTVMTYHIPGTILKEATFLGTIFNCSGTLLPEVEARCAAARRGWYHMNKFWTECKQW